MKSLFALLVYSDARDKKLLQVDNLSRIKEQNRMRIIELCTMNIGRVPRKPLIHECDRIGTIQ